MAPSQELQDRIEKLNALYRLYEEEIKQFSLACTGGCATCCTCNVTATSLEVAHLLSRMDADEKNALKSALEQRLAPRRYQPRFTTNAYAKACMDGQDLEDDENNPAWGACPFLGARLCTIYGLRPLGCRAMMSQTPCAGQGFADMPDLGLTLSNLMDQYIEHLDIKGFSGNFFDVLQAYFDHGAGDSTALPLYLSFNNLKDSDKKEKFIRNQHIPALMVPPAHRKAVSLLVRKASALAGPGNTFAQ